MAWHLPEPGIRYQVIFLPTDDVIGQKHRIISSGFETKRKHVKEYYDFFLDFNFKGHYWVITCEARLILCGLENGEGWTADKGALSKEHNVKAFTFVTESFMVYEQE